MDIVDIILNKLNKHHLNETLSHIFTFHNDYSVNLVQIHHKEKRFNAIRISLEEYQDEYLIHLDKECAIFNTMYLPFKTRVDIKFYSTELSNTAKLWYKQISSFILKEKVLPNIEIPIEYCLDSKINFKYESRFYKYIRGDAYFISSSKLGRSLHDLIDEELLSESEVLEICKQVDVCIDIYNRIGFCHGNLVPDNVMIVNLNEKYNFKVDNVIISTNYLAVIIDFRNMYIVKDSVLDIFPHEKYDVRYDFGGRYDYNTFYLSLFSILMKQTSGKYININADITINILNELNTLNSLYDFGFKEIFTLSNISTESNNFEVIKNSGISEGNENHLTTKIRGKEFLDKALKLKLFPKTNILLEEMKMGFDDDNGDDDNNNDDNYLNTSDNTIRDNWMKEKFGDNWIHRIFKSSEIPDRFKNHWTIEKVNYNWVITDEFGNDWIVSSSGLQDAYEYYYGIEKIIYVAGKIRNVTHRKTHLYESIGILKTQVEDDNKRAFPHEYKQVMLKKEIDKLYAELNEETERYNIDVAKILNLYIEIQEKYRDFVILELQVKYSMRGEKDIAIKYNMQLNTINRMSHEMHKVTDQLKFRRLPTMSYMTTFIGLTDEVDRLFPHISRQYSPEEIEEILSKVTAKYDEFNKIIKTTSILKNILSLGLGIYVGKLIVEYAQSKLNMPLEIPVVNVKIREILTNLNKNKTYYDMLPSISSKYNSGNVFFRQYVNNDKIVENNTYYDTFGLF